MTWTVTKVFAFCAMVLGFALTIIHDDGNIWIATMTSCGIILGIKNLPNATK